MRIVRKAMGVLGVSGAVIALSIHPAVAEDGYVFAAGYAANTVYHDNGDTITVIDNAPDGEGAVGWIAVLQADGKTYKPFPHIYVGSGFQTRTTVTQDVIREGAPYRIYSCIQNGPYGKWYNCGIRNFSGS